MNLQKLFSAVKKSLKVKIQPHKLVSLLPHLISMNEYFLCYLDIFAFTIT